jgi:hypothetical protein
LVLVEDYEIIRHDYRCVVVAIGERAQAGSYSSGNLCRLVKHWHEACGVALWVVTKDGEGSLGVFGTEPKSAIDPAGRQSQAIPEGDQPVAGEDGHAAPPSVKGEHLLWAWPPRQPQSA